MHAFDQDERIHKYKSSKQIFNVYFDVRFNFYTKRRTHLLKKFENKIKYLDAKAMFIMEVIKKTLKIMQVKEDVIIADLVKKGYPKQESSYEYLLRLPVRTFTKEKIEALNKEIGELQTKKNTLKNKTEADLWKEDLEDFEQEYKKIDKKRNDMIEKDVIQLQKLLKKKK